MSRSYPIPPRRARSGGGPLAGLGPAFVVAIAYVDPGNVVTNVAAGSRQGYLLVWVVVAASAAGALIQFLAAKVGTVTGMTLPELCRERYPRPVVLALWAQAECVAAATDLAEVIGGALALRMLFGVPLVAGGLLTAALSFVVLLVQSGRGQRRLEAVLAGMLLVVLLGFTGTALAAGAPPKAVAAGLVPGLHGADTVLLAAGILGATVMPHVIYLHTALYRDRAGGSGEGGPGGTLVAMRWDVASAMALAGVANLALLLAGAGTGGRGVDSVDAAYRIFAQDLGRYTGLLFAVALLVSGVASTSVGTYAGAVIMQGFLRRRIPLTVRRALTVLPALVALVMGLDPTQAVVISQVVLSFGIPFALWPLVAFARSRTLMGEHASRRPFGWVSTGLAACITGLNAVLGALLFAL